MLKPLYLKKTTSTLLILGSTFFISMGQSIQAQEAWWDYAYGGVGKNVDVGYGGDYLRGYNYAAGWDQPLRVVIQNGRMFEEDPTGVNPGFKNYVAQIIRSPVMTLVRWDPITPQRGMITMGYGGARFEEVAAGVPMIVEGGSTYGVSFKGLTMAQKQSISQHLIKRAPGGDVYHMEERPGGVTRFFMSGNGFRALQELGTIRNFPAEIMIFRGIQGRGEVPVVDFVGAREVWESEDRGGQPLKWRRKGQGEEFYTSVSPRGVMAMQVGLMSGGLKGGTLRWAETGVVADGVRVFVPTAEWGYKREVPLGTVFHDMDRIFVGTDGEVMMKMVVPIKYMGVFQKFQGGAEGGKLMISPNVQGKFTLALHEKELASIRKIIENENERVRDIRVIAQPVSSERLPSKVFKLSTADLKRSVEKKGSQKLGDGEKASDRLRFVERRASRGKANR